MSAAAATAPSTKTARGTAGEAREFSRNGVRIAYRVSGKGPSIIFGHSLLCDGRMWDGVIEALGGRYTIYNVDARGHGGSTAPGPFTLEDLADDWRALLDHEKISRALLCGLSMGGMTAMRLALASPERVRALALLDTSADPQPAWERVKFRAMAEIVRRFGHLKFLYGEVEKVMFGRASRTEQRALVDAQMERFREQVPGEVYWAVRAVIDRGSIHARLPSLRVPARVIVGADDRATPPDRSRRIAAQLAGASLVEIARAGHLSALEFPGELARELAPFFDAAPE